MSSNMKKALTVIIITVVALSGVVGFITFKALNRDSEESPNDSISDVIIETITDNTELSQTDTTTTITTTTLTTTTTVTTTTHVSPIENISYSMGNEKGEINEILDYDSNKTYKVKLSELAEDGDNIESFVFVFYANDGTSNIGSYKGACGISVAENCPSATDDSWYQSEDFDVSVNSSYVEIKWDVPAEIRDYITIDDKSFIEIGYWWGDIQKLRLESVICNYSTTAELPVDGSKTIEPNANLYYGSESQKTTRINLSELLNDNDIPQMFIFEIEANGELKKFSGAFGITVEDNCPSKTDDYWYQSKNIGVMTNSSNLKLYWKVPDDIKDYIKTDAELMLGYWWSNQENITLKSVTAKYSNDGTKANNTDSDAEKVVNTNIPSGIVKGTAMNNISSEQIVNDMRIGWNLGNTLECHNITWDVENYETGWGNPVTTKAMIDEVKNAGFNAVRIPITWSDHMNGDTIDSAWMSRVNEVVDYVIDNDMYAIINIHHDDADWLVPTYANEEQARLKLIKIWEQISANFKDYDHRLIFEGMNEPRVIGSDTEWIGGTDEERDVINHLSQAFVDTVRNSGGNNEYRHLIITSHAASITDSAVKAVVVPDDERIIVSIHYYAPWDFINPDSDVAEWGTDTDKSELDKGFDLLKTTFIDKNVPVIIGEFGSVDKNNTATRTAYTEYYIKSAKSRGITCFLWDNGLKKEFGLFNRLNLTWHFPDIINVAIEASK